MKMIKCPDTVIKCTWSSTFIAITFRSTREKIDKSQNAPEINRTHFSIVHKQHYNPNYILYEYKPNIVKAL